jgi:outer membrane protein assembly factor BamB
VKEDGDFSKPNSNSAAVWHYTTYDRNKNKKADFEETMHRTMGTVTIKDDLLYVADLSGLVHCVNARTGVPYWTHDMLALSWGTPLIVENHVYIGDEDGDITVFEHSNKKNVISEITLGNSVYSTPIVANNGLYISNKDQLFLIVEGASSKPMKSKATSSSEAE